jgi:hypothetical protein
MTTYTVTTVRDGKRVLPRKAHRSYYVARTYYGKRLLEHGPLTGREFRDITGWPEHTSARVLDNLRETGVAVRDGRLWRLAE